MNCAKFFVITINICFLVLSVLIISAASTPRFSFGDYFTVLTADNDIGSLHLIWIGGAFVLMAVGVFGLWSALKESTFMMNLYTVIVSLVLILQVVTAVTSNTLSGELDYHVSNSLKRLMVQYGNNYEFTSVMDSIQKEYKCCGNYSPYDWYLLEQFTTTKKTTHRTTKKRTLLVTEPTIVNELEQGNYLQEILENRSANEFSLPTSCCKTKKCSRFHDSGCFILLYNDILHAVLMVRTVAMVSLILQIFGIWAAVIFGRILRLRKVNRVTHIQR